MWDFGGVWLVGHSAPYQILIIAIIVTDIIIIMDIMIPNNIILLCMKQYIKGGDGHSSALSQVPAYILYLPRIAL